jgi:hypothetical protein
MVKTQGDTYRQSQLVLSSQQDLHTEEWGLLDLLYIIILWLGKAKKADLLTAGADKSVKEGRRKSVAF